MVTSSETSEWSTEGSSTNVQSFEANWPGKLAPGATASRNVGLSSYGKRRRPALGSHSATIDIDF